MADRANSLDLMSLPVGAKPESDMQVGMDDLGYPILQTILGDKYSTQPAQQAGKKFDSEPMSWDRFGDVGMAALYGLFDSIKSGATLPRRALDGQPTTLGDMMNLSGMVTLGAGAALAPQGSDAITGGGGNSQIDGGAGKDKMATFPQSLIQTESGGNWKAQNSEVGAGGKAGHYGRLQFGNARLDDAKRAGVIPSTTTPQQFMADPAMQQRVEQWHFADIDKKSANLGLTKYIGQNIGGTTITQDSIRAMAHLGGIVGAARFLKSGGKDNPADSFGTSLADYAKTHAGGAIMGGGGADTMMGGDGGDTVAPAPKMVDWNDLVDFGDPSAVATAYNAPQAAGGMVDWADLVDMGQAPVVDVAAPPVTPSGGFQQPQAPQESMALSGAQQGLSLANQALSGVLPFGQGGVVQTPSSLPLGVGDVQVPIPAPVRAVADFAGNAALVPLGLASAAYSAVTGGIGDVARGTGLLSNESAGRLVNDLNAMPEAFAGSPASLARPVVGTGHAISTGKVAPVAKAAARVEPPPIAKPVVSPDAIAKLVESASGKGFGSKAAMQDLARIAKVDPEAAAAAKRLGMELPADVFSQEVPVQQLAGALRGLKGSDAANDFIEAYKGAQTKASEAMAAIDGATSLSEVSEGVMQSLRGTQASLKIQEGQLFDAVNAKIPPASPAPTPATKSLLDEIATNMGGADKLKGLDADLHKLTSSETPMTYYALTKLQRDIGKAMNKGQGPYATESDFHLGQIYDALKNDRMSVVESIGGPNAVATLKAANGLTVQRKELEKKIVSAFGKDLQGSIAPNLSRSFSKGAQGDVTQLNRVLSVIPPELHKETILSAINSAASAKSAAGGFGFAQYEKMYRGLRNNAPIYAKIAKAVGPEAERVLGDLYRVSKAVNTAAGSIERTGKANQAQNLGVLAAEGLTQRILQSTAGKTAARGIGAMIGGVLGSGAGPVGAAMGVAGGDAMVGALAKAGPKKLEAASKLLNSEAFRDLAVEVATKPTPSKKKIASVAFSPAFRQYAKAINIKDPQAWLLGIVTAQGAQNGGD